MKNLNITSLAYFGAPGSFHHVASKHFAPGVEKKSTPSFEKVFAAVMDGEVDAGLIAIENSIAGSLNDNYDLMLEYDVKVVGEIYLHISHNLLAPAGTKVEDITSVYSHPMAIRQCHGFLKSHDIQWHDMSSTAAAAEYIQKQGKPTEAAIGSSLAAELYDLNVIKQSLETDKMNYTRFFVIQKELLVEVETSRTSLAFKVAHQPGSLAKVFNVFAAKMINIIKIQSRPIMGTDWEYYFYLDCDASVAELEAKGIFIDMGIFCSWYKVLGTYVRGEVVEG